MSKHREDSLHCAGFMCRTPAMKITLVILKGAKSPFLNFTYKFITLRENSTPRENSCLLYSVSSVALELCQVWENLIWDCVRRLQIFNRRPMLKLEAWNLKERATNWALHSSNITQLSSRKKEPEKPSFSFHTFFLQARRLYYPQYNSPTDSLATGVLCSHDPVSLWP